MSSAVDLDLSIDIHLGLEFKTGVRNIQPSLCLPRLFIDVWVDVRNLSVEGDTRIVREGHAGPLAGSDKRNFAFVYIDVYPYGGEISDGVQFLIRHDPHSLIGFLFNHKTRVG